MDEELEDFIEAWSEPSEIDSDYEYDASRFFDFSHPELDYEAREAERWFETARSCPPSPFVIMLKWRKDNASEYANISLNLEGVENMNSTSNNSDIDPDVSSSEENTKGPKYHEHMVHDTLKAKSLKPRSSTLMKPTASHLAKQNKARDIYSSRLRGRFQKPSNATNEGHLQHSLGFENQATKRQKLEYGYLCKVAHLRHQNLLLHKVGKKVGSIDSNSTHSRSKVTIPREPDLETAQRAQRQRSKNKSGSGEQVKPSTRVFKARPLNRKILEAPSLLFPKKSTPQLPDFQVFHLKTKERAMQHSSDNVPNTHNPLYVIPSGSADFKRPNTEDTSKQKKCETLNKFKTRPLNKKMSSKADTGVIQNINQETAGECQLPNDKSLLHAPPIELFNKLCLKSEVETNCISQPKPHLSVKGLKENAPRSFQLQHWRSNGKLNQCGSDRWIPESKSQTKINRSLDIR